MSDILTITPSFSINTYVKEVNLFIQRLKRPDFLTVYIIILILFGIFLFSYIVGIMSEWYNNLQQSTLNPWIPRILWILSGFFSYAAIYIIWEDAETGYPRDLTITVLYIIGMFLMLGWSLSLYQLQDIGLAVWFSVILFLYQLWLTIYIWYIDPLASIFLIPILLMYLYLIYNTINLATLNNIPL